MQYFANHTSSVTDDTSLPILIGSMVIVLAVTVAIVAIYKNGEDR